MDFTVTQCDLDHMAYCYSRQPRVGSSCASNFYQKREEYLQSNFFHACCAFIGGRRDYVGMDL